MDKRQRCGWCLGFDAYQLYHDKEWGVPTYTDQTHFEFLVLEGAQAGLSWSTILKKREGYRTAFAQFNVEKVARFKDAEIKKLLSNPEIIRNKLKVRAAINNAICFLQVQKEFGSFNNYIWSFVGHKPITNQWTSLSQMPARSEVSDALSSALKKRGFKFVGSIIMYAYMQACGLVNDHLISCFRYQEIREL